MDACEDTNFNQKLSFKTRFVKGPAYFVWKNTTHWQLVAYSSFPVIRLFFYSLHLNAEQHQSRMNINYHWIVLLFKSLLCSSCREVVSYDTVCWRTVCRLLWPNHWKQWVILYLLSFKSTLWFNVKIVKTALFFL